MQVLDCVAVFEAAVNNEVSNLSPVRHGHLRNHVPDKSSRSYIMPEQTAGIQGLFGMVGSTLGGERWFTAHSSCTTFVHWGLLRVFLLRLSAQ